ncbi:hypothetical protein QYE76_016046 [Lolium multiflorum]|uniref:Uncharacterized protein n=1 Tax=Lolium multiflorum TaxID=4521 RepID=A0AAD8XAC9_LOLMU|nr:hypothetical protein QYE76_016046 [Lolium multiflorum]
MCPERRQTMVYSATIIEQIDEHMKLSLNKQLRLEADPSLNRPAAPATLTEENVWGFKAFLNDYYSSTMHLDFSSALSEHDKPLAKEIIQDVNGLEIAVVTKDGKMREDGALQFLVDKAIIF